MTGPVTHGADIEALRTWAVAAQQGGRDLDRMNARLTNALLALAWTGNDQRAFLEQWQTRFSPSMTTTGGALIRSSVQVTREADEQAIASDVAGAHDWIGGRHGSPQDDARERAEAAWSRGAGRLVLGLLGSALGGPKGSILGAVAGPRLVGHLVGVSQERAARTVVTEVSGHRPAAPRVPTSAGDVLHDLADTYDRPGTVRTDLITRPDGSQVAVIHVPGTQGWSFAADSESPMGGHDAVAAASGKDSPLRRLSIGALEELPPGVPIHLLSHSQGSFAALDLAADPYVQARFNIASVVTTGAGGGNFDVPAHIDVISIRNPNDVVGRIGGSMESATHVQADWGARSPGAAHSSRGYADFIATNHVPALERWFASTGITGDSTTQVRVFQGTVTPRR